MSPQETKESKGIGEMLGEAGATVKDGLVGSLKGLSEIEAQIVSLARNTVTDVLKGTGSVANETINISKDVFKGALKATEEVGAGLLVTTKDVAKGILLGVTDLGGDAEKAAAQLAKGAVKGAAEVGGDVAQVAKSRGNRRHRGHFRDRRQCGRGRQGGGGRRHRRRRQPGSVGGQGRQRHPDGCGLWHQGRSLRRLAEIQGGVPHGLQAGSRSPSGKEDEGISIAAVSLLAKQSRISKVIRPQWSRRYVPRWRAGRGLRLRACTARNPWRSCWSRDWRGCRYFPGLGRCPHRQCSGLLQFG